MTYRTGETPNIGDVVLVHGMQSSQCSHLNGTEQVVEQFSDDCIGLVGDAGPYWTDKFDLIRRAVTSPARRRGLDTIYAKLRDTKLVRTSETCIGRVLIDYDANNDPVGVEIIGCQVDGIDHLREVLRDCAERIRTLVENTEAVSFMVIESGQPKRHRTQTKVQIADLARLEGMATIIDELLAKTA